MVHGLILAPSSGCSAGNGPPSAEYGCQMAGLIGGFMHNDKNRYWQISWKVRGGLYQHLETTRRRPYDNTSLWQGSAPPFLSFGSCRDGRLLAVVIFPLLQPAGEQMFNSSFTLLNGQRLLPVLIGDILLRATAYAENDLIAQSVTSKTRPTRTFSWL
jgi:hypothetical protein